MSALGYPHLHQGDSLQHWWEPWPRWVQSWLLVLIRDAGMRVPVPESCHVPESAAVDACPLASSCIGRRRRRGQRCCPIVQGLGAVLLHQVLHPAQVMVEMDVGFSIHSLPGQWGWVLLPRAGSAIALEVWYQWQH